MFLTDPLMKYQVGCVYRNVTSKFHLFSKEIIENCDFAYNYKSKAKISDPWNCQFLCI